MQAYSSISSLRVDDILPRIMYVVMSQQSLHISPTLGFTKHLTQLWLPSYACGSRQCPYNEPETGNIPGPGAYGSLHDYSSFNKPVPKTLTDEKIGFSSTGKRTSPGPSPQTAGMPGPGDYDLEVQSIAGGLRHKSRIGCKGVFG